MIVAIVGSRTITDFPLGEILERIPGNCSGIVSGGAVGVDQFARAIADILDVPLTEFYPDYARFGRRAPLLRNDRIADFCDFLIAIWDYQSNGTRYTLLSANKLGKKIDIICPPSDDIARTTKLKQQWEASFATSTKANFWT